MSPVTTSQSQNSGTFTLWLICAAVILYSGSQTILQLRKQWPIHQWESGLLAEGQRAAIGMPVFEPAETGHATHMYGPAMTWMLAVVYQYSGPGFLPARLISLLGIAGTMGLLLAVLARQRHGLATCCAVALLAAFGPCIVNFVEPRPDCICLLPATIAILLMAAAWRRESGVMMAGASLFIVAAMLLKQPAAMVAAIPAAVFCVSPAHQRSRIRFVLITIPLTAVAATLTLLAGLFPETYHYVVVVPSSYSLSMTDLLLWTLKLSIALSALLCLKGGTSAAFGNLSESQRWTLAALAVTVPCCLMTASKTGGNANCLLPAIVAASAVMMAFGREIEQGIRRAEPLTRWIPLPPATYLGLALVAAFALSLTTNVRTDVSYGDSGFATVVEFLRTSESRAACPQDPAVAVLSGRRPGRCLMLEYDAAGWPEQVPHWFFDELETAEFAVSVGNGHDWRFWPLSGPQMEDFLRSQGFAPVDSEGLRGSVYRLWQRAESDVAQAERVPARHGSSPRSRSS